MVLITIGSTNAEVNTIYRDTTLVSSQLVTDRLIQEVNQKQTKNFNETDPECDLENVMKSIGKKTTITAGQTFECSIDGYSDIFSLNQWELGKCNATSHRIGLKPGSQPIELPNRRMPEHYKYDLKEKIDAFMRKELITPCHSPYSAPAMLETERMEI